MGLYKQKLNTRTGQFNLVSSNLVITFKESVPTFADLPLVGNTQNDARITDDTGHLYVWDGSTWIDQGDIIDLKWAAIEDKPSSAVADIDDIVSKGIKSTAAGDEKKIISMTYNPTTGLITINYEV